MIRCDFENELFAAFMMGASRSGKSTLLHTIICSLLMDYHPDELELWLLDFKMLEFKNMPRTGLRISNTFSWKNRRIWFLISSTR